MAKKFSELEAKMTAEQIAKSNALYQQMADELEHTQAQPLETDVMDWLIRQNAHTKHYVNEMVRNVMRMQMV